MTHVAIIDYRLNNLFSVESACRSVGLDPVVTSRGQDLSRAAGCILPGVGAFGAAINKLQSLDLIDPIREFVSAGNPVLGICLGMQLLFEESDEFGCTQGLGLLKGRVSSLRELAASTGSPGSRHIGWNKIWLEENNDNSLLKNVPTGEYMYFVHSHAVQPSTSGISSSISHFGEIRFCSSIEQDNIYATQFHPEKSGAQGLKVYKNFKNLVSQRYE